MPSWIWRRKKLARHDFRAGGAELQQLQKFLGAFSIAWPEAHEFQKAYDLLVTHRLATGLSIPDSIIAAMALVRGARFYTFNLKHFKGVPSLDVQQPYSR